MERGPAGMLMSGAPCVGWTRRQWDQRSQGQRLACVLCSVPTPSDLLGSALRTMTNCRAVWAGNEALEVHLVKGDVY